MTSGIPSDPDSLQDLRYDYDANGNVTTIQDYKAGTPQTQSFTYDTLDRLISAEASGGTYGNYGPQEYDYDPISGNLSNRAGVSYTYGDANHAHAVTGMGSNTYGYDANGNQVTRTISGSTSTLSYDPENRLVGVSGAVTATFKYDGDGNRVTGSVNGGTTITYIGDYFEWTSTTNDMKKYYYAGSSRVAMRTGPSTLNYLLGDHSLATARDRLGSITVAANRSGVKSAEQLYYPWGTACRAK